MSNKDDFDLDNENMDLGIQALLGKADYPEPEKVVDCEHEDDGHIYEESATGITLWCTKCLRHYTISKITGKITG